MFFARFIGAFGIAVVTIIGSSVLWPTITKTPRPAILEQVNTSFKQTPFGERVENVLGVSDEAVDLKTTIASASSSVVHTVGEKIQSKAEDLIQSRISEEIIRRYELLPVGDKENVKSIICAPAGQQ